MWLNANVTLKYVPMPLQVFSLNVFQLLISFEVVKWGKKKKKKTTKRKLDTVRVKMDFTELLSQLLVYKICFRQLFIMSKTADDIFVQCW